MNNSISYNPLNDSLVAKNYLALAYCVVGIELDKKRYYPTITGACRAFELLEINNKSNISENKNNVDNKKEVKKYKKRSDTKVIVTNTLTGEDIVYNSSKEVAKILGVQHNRIYNYIYAGTRYKNIYQMRFEDMEKHDLKPTRQKKVKCTNEKTGEVIIKDSMKEAAKQLGIRQDQMTYLARKGKKTKAGWRIEKI